MEKHNKDLVSGASMAPKRTSASVTRRSFVAKAAAVGALAGVADALAAPRTLKHSASLSGADIGYSDILRTPDLIRVYTEIAVPLVLTRSGDEWQSKGILIECAVGETELKINVHAEHIPLQYIHLRWNAPVSDAVQVLGDQWERSYGDLGWRNMIPERVMPWYMATYDGRRCNAYGVKTSARALCFWQMDTNGISLWLNVSNGGAGVVLGQRVLAAATVITRRGSDGERIVDALHSFCKQLCSRPPRRFEPVYGINDWYYAYGENSSQQIVKDADYVAELSDANAFRPFCVVDMGWVDGSQKYPSMRNLANNIRSRNVRPGIWIRPLLAPTSANPKWLNPKSKAQDPTYDPTIAEAREKVLDNGRQAVAWGYELVKQDFLTYDLLGRWGNEMGAQCTLPGWSFNDRSITNAEIILDLYKDFRTSCGDHTMLTGCNAICHLGQGYFDIQRTGDDTSGKVWDRTRFMGVNTLAFRLPQHKAFSILDPDCVGLRPEVSWELNRQWMDLIAHTGTALFVSPAASERTSEHTRAIREAFQLAASGGDGAYPEDCLRESTPRIWSTVHEKLRYNWIAEDGVSPFPI